MVPYAMTCRRVLLALLAVGATHGYDWCYADEALCVAMGSSGSVAVWEAVPKDATPDGTETTPTR